MKYNIFLNSFLMFKIKSDNVVVYGKATSPILCLCEKVEFSTSNFTAMFDPRNVEDKDVEDRVHSNTLLRFIKIFQEERKKGDIKFEDVHFLKKLHSLNDTRKIFEGETFTEIVDRVKKDKIQIVNIVSTISTINAEQFINLIYLICSDIKKTHNITVKEKYGDSCALNPTKSMITVEKSKLEMNASNVFKTSEKTNNKPNVEVSNAFKTSDKYETNEESEVTIQSQEDEENDVKKTICQYDVREITNKTWYKYFETTFGERFESVELSCSIISIYMYKKYKFKDFLSDEIMKKIQTVEKLPLTQGYSKELLIDEILKRTIRQEEGFERKTKGVRERRVALYGVKVLVDECSECFLKMIDRYELNKTKTTDIVENKVNAEVNVKRWIFKLYLPEMEKKSYEEIKEYLLNYKVFMQCEKNYKNMLKLIFTFNEYNTRNKSHQDYKKIFETFFEDVYEYIKKNVAENKSNASIGEKIKLSIITIPYLHDIIKALDFQQIVIKEKIPENIVILILQQIISDYNKAKSAKKITESNRFKEFNKISQKCIEYVKKEMKLV